LPLTFSCTVLSFILCVALFGPFCIPVILPPSHLNPTPPQPHPTHYQRRLSLVSYCSSSMFATVYVECLSNKMMKASQRFFVGRCVVATTFVTLSFCGFSEMVRTRTQDLP
jgi:hypothetical protein